MTYSADRTVKQELSTPGEGMVQYMKKQKVGKGDYLGPAGKGPDSIPFSNDQMICPSDSGALEVDLAGTPAG